MCGLHPNDGAVYRKYAVAEYLAGYAGPPPMVHLRRGQRLRRYQQPGLADGKTFVFWGRNYKAGGVPGPERSLTWVNQPENQDMLAWYQDLLRLRKRFVTLSEGKSAADYAEGVLVMKVPSVNSKILVQAALQRGTQLLTAPQGWREALCSDEDGYAVRIFVRESSF